MTVRTLISTLAASIAISACSPQTQEAPQQTSPATQTVAAPVELAKPSPFLSRDIRDEVFYFVLPDRFYNANPDNDEGSKDIAISRGGFFPKTERGFHGGDIQGIEEKLDYLEGMGVTAIWMTPILRNRAVQNDGYAHHGYWILDFSQIDPHFGSNDDLKSLIDAAHKRDIKIFFDIITNHTADVIKYEECHNPDGTHQEGLTECKYKSLEQVAAGDTYTPFLVEGEENVKFPEWLNDPKYYHNQGDSFWQGESAINGDFVGLDDLKTTDPQVVSGMIEIYQNIISEFKPDGFRIDTVKHVHMSFWEEFSPAILSHAKEQGIPEFFIFGEVYSGDPVVLSSFTTKGKMPSVLDFGLQWAGSEVIYRRGDNDAIRRLFDNDDYYNDHDSQADLLMNFLGNHDMGRSGFFLQEALPDISDQEMVERTLLAHAFMYTSRGVPVIYYGDEQGFTGDGGDIYAREDMFPSQVDSYNDNNLIGTDATTADDNFDPSHPLYQGLRELAALRQSHKALRHGIHQNRDYNDNGVFSFSRVDLDEKREYLVLFNPKNQAHRVKLAATAEQYASITGPESEVINGEVIITLPPRSMAMLKAATPIAPAGDLSISLAGTSVEDGRVSFEYEVGQSDSEHLNLYEVTTEVADAEGNFARVATDYTFPYRAILHEDEIAAGQQVRVTVSNLAGEQESDTFVYQP